MMTRAIVFLAAMGLMLSPARAGLKIYYLRHAEVGDNVSAEWKNLPVEEQPSYAMNRHSFTPKGDQQVAQLPEKLAKYHFDFIAVSPRWRARHTILPYLQATGQKGEIWPELTEIGGPEREPDPATLPPPSAGLFSAGARIGLPHEEAGYFTLRAGGDRELAYGKQGPQLDSDRRAALERMLAVIKQRFGGSEKSILLMGHGSEGRYLANFLAGYQDERIKNADNTALWMAEEQPDGSFRMRMINDQPVRSSPGAKN